MYRLNEVADLLGFDYPLENSFEKISFDSREIDGETLFFALSGDRADGHDFLEDVARKKAVGAVVSKSYVGSNFGLPLLFVDDPLFALQEFARKTLEKRDPKILAITGSVGKTTTKEFLYTLVSDWKKVGKTYKSYNSQRGLPYSILNMKGDEEWLILEMSMSERGNLSRLVTIAPPHIALVTKVALQHAEFFTNIEAIAEAKAEILQSKNLKKAILSSQVMQFAPFQRELQAEKIIYSQDDAQSDGNAMRLFKHGKEIAAFTLPFTATHLHENAYAAIIAANQMGMSFDEIAKRVHLLKPASRRFESLMVRGTHVINDSYNSSPESVIYALNNLPKVKGKRIVVLGELGELGKYTDESYQMITDAALQFADHLLSFGEGAKRYTASFAKENKPSTWFSNKLELKSHLYSLMTPEDVVLIKGGNMNQLWELVE